MLAEDVPARRSGARPRPSRFAALRWEWRTIVFCYVALLPVLALFAYVRVVPIAWSAILSFYKWNLISPLKPFIGFTNYELLLSDENFLIAMKNTLVYSFATVGFSTVLA